MFNLKRSIAFCTTLLVVGVTLLPPAAQAGERRVRRGENFSVGRGGAGKRTFYNGPKRNYYKGPNRSYYKGPNGSVYKGPKSTTSPQPAPGTTP